MSYRLNCDGCGREAPAPDSVNLPGGWGRLSAGYSANIVSNTPRSYELCHTCFGILAEKISALRLAHAS